MNIKINEDFFEKFLAVGNNSFFHIIKDSDGNILFPKDSNKIELRNNILKSKQDDLKRYDLDDMSCYSMLEKELVLDGEVLFIETYINETINKKRQSDLQIDYLTKLKNRQLTLESSKEYIEDAIKEGNSFALVMCDIDYFKKINDEYGHDIGDYVLKNIGDYFKHHTRQDKKRKIDIIGRIGGEEFLVLLKDISLIDAVRKVYLLQTNFKNEVTVHQNGITMSCGMCHFDPNKYDLDKISSVEDLLSDLMKKCDKALYFSKKQGRDSTSIYDLLQEDDNDLLKKHIKQIKKNS